MHICIRFGIDFIALMAHFLTVASWNQQLVIACLKSSWVYIVSSIYFKWSLTHAQKFSIGFKSGLYSGCLCISQLSSLKKSIASLLLWIEALSCKNLNLAYVFNWVVSFKLFANLNIPTRGKPYVWFASSSVIGLLLNKIFKEVKGDCAIGALPSLSLPKHEF